MRRNGMQRNAMDLTMRRESMGRIQHAHKRRAANDGGRHSTRTGISVSIQPTATEWTQTAVRNATSQHRISSMVVVAYDDGAE
mmetsp:Transcript_9502/g.25814  ORF Transcript_9502/g.25814 Transcript_9502/m.25814 type:complete len:83 (-) Transcript_9502:2056-2304(-)